MSIRNMLPGALAGAIALLVAPAVAAQADVVLPSTDLPVQGVVGGTEFPDASRARIDHGDFVNTGNLRQMGPGLGKSQVRRLLGNPHFSEGLAGVSRWDYVFNFRTGADSHITCQYQVNYGTSSGKYRVESMHWDRPECLAALNPRAEAAVAHAPVVHVLSADALFAFDRSGVEDILPGGREEVAALARELSGAGDTRITVVGHADRLGAPGYNQALSEQRALTVRQLLVAGGLSADAVDAYGRGANEPVTICDRSLDRDELIACLKPDRRVEVRIQGQH